MKILQYRMFVHFDYFTIHHFYNDRYVVLLNIAFPKHLEFNAQQFLKWF